MTTCRDFVDFLSEYLAGDLSDDEVRIFDAHLAECPHCTAYLADYRFTVELARESRQGTMPAAPIPDELIRAILAARPPTSQPPPAIS